MSILSAGYFFAIAGLLGITLIRWFKLNLPPALAGAAGLIGGAITLTHLIFWQSWLLPFNRLTILITTALVLVGCSGWWLKRREAIKLKLDLAASFKWAVWIGGWIVIWLIVWRRMLYQESGGLFAGWVNIWGDWAAHLSYTTSFAFGDNFPVKMPLLIGAKFSYPFLVDFLSAILIKLGSGLIPAMLLPGMIFSTALVVILTGFGQTLAQSFKAGKLTAMVFLFNGGLGWWWWLKDIQTSGLGPTLTNLPREYTHLEKLFNIEWINIITSQVIPQRGFLLGFPAATLVYLFFWYYWQNHRPRYLLAAGLLTALLPLVHAHSLAIVAAVGVGLFLLKPNKNWFYFFLPLLILALPVIAYFYWSSVGTSGFIRYFPGWLATKRGDNLLWFWAKNLGLMAILPLLGLKLSPVKLRWFSLPFWLIFAAANLWLFQPWEWDNTKFFVHWYLIACVLASAVLAKLPKTLAAILLTITVGAGLLDVWRLTQYPYRKIKFWTNEQLQLADWVKTNTPPGAKFLTADNHDHWLPTLTGRQILLGFKGWLWTYGLDYSQQEKAAAAIFAGRPEAEASINAYGLTYAVIGPMEREVKPPINETWFKQNYRLVFQTATTQIYSLTD